MKKNRLLGSLESQITNLSVRRYSLADMISESYKTIYRCEEGSNLKKLAESHLEDVKQNPRETEKLSRQLAIIKELVKMEESNLIKDEDLVDEKNFDEIEGKEDRVIVKRKSIDESEDPSEDPLEKESIEEADDPELTDEELEELAKHLENIRKEKKGTPNTEMKEDLHEVDNPDQWVTQYGIDILQTEGQEDMENRIELALEKAGLAVLGVQPTDASWSKEKYEKMTGHHIGESKEEKIEDCNDSSLYEGLKWDWFEDQYMAPAHWESEAPGYVFNIYPPGGTDYEGYGVEVLDDKEYDIVANEDFPTRKAAIEWIEKKYTSDSLKNESKSLVSESKAYEGLENFKKQSESKAFYKTFKKMHESLKEGKALTRQESIDLYKAANSALTQMSIELEHNPEFLNTFKESTTPLSADVNSLRESLANGKAPSKKTMKSLAKFSEALLYESEDDDEDLDDTETHVDDISAEETPEDFVGDNEGDMQSEEADAFDQEYADARFELHSDLEAKHADDEDPEVQEKLDQDAAEVMNLPGTTEEQIAELSGEESTENSEEEDHESDDNEDDSDGGEVDDEITDDELEELKKHLQEMRASKKK